MNSSTGKPLLNILLVDDDIDDRELFVEALHSIDGHSQVETLDQSEGLVDALLSMDPLPHFLFLDLNMPRKSGKECLKEIRRHDSLRKVKIVIYTTSINPKDVTETYQLGAFCFFQKPNSFGDLKRLLQQVISTTELSYTLGNGFVVTGAK
jgi:DNA-binding NtrC family response regulator